MRSLESIIRDVVEGKCCCEKKKKSLEHTIRDKVEEAKVLSPGPQFKGNQFTAKNQQPGVLNPPKGGGHVSQEGISASTKRNAVLQKKAAVTEKVDYADPPTATKIDLPPEAPKNLPATVDPKKAVKAATSQTTKAATTTATKAAEKASTAVATKAATEVATKGGMATAAKVGARALGPIGAAMTVSDVVGKVATGTETGRAVGKWIGDNVPGAKTAANMMRKAGEAIGVRDAAPPKQEVKTQTKTAEPPTKPTETKTAPAAPPPVKAPPIVAPPVAAPTTSTLAKVATAAAVPAAIATIPGIVKTATKAVSPAAPKSSGGSAPPTVSDKYTKDDRFFNPSVLHTARPHKKFYKEETDRKDIEVMPRQKNERKKVQYVGRDQDTKARLSALKNVVEEAIKKAKDKKLVGTQTKVFPTAIVNPDLNKSEPNA